MPTKTLTSAQQALLQFLESMAITAVIAGLFAVEPLITTQGALDWRQISVVFLLAFLFSVAHGVVAYFKPTNVLLSATIEAIVDAVEKRQTSQTVQGPLVVVHTVDTTKSMTEPDVVQSKG